MRKKFTVKKIVLLSILILILSIVGFVANAFNGNPVSKYLAKREYNNYIEETYPNTDFRINKVYYNFKDGNYWTKASSKSKKIEFGLSRRYDDIIDDEYRDQPILEDRDTSFRFREEMENEIIKEIVEVNKIDLLKDIYVDMSFPQGKYDENSKFTRDIDEEFKIQINLSKSNDKGINSKVSDDKIEDEEVARKLVEENKEGAATNKGSLLGKEDTKKVEPKPVKDEGIEKEDIENKEKVIVIDEEFIDAAYKIKEIIIDMGYIGLTQIVLQFQDNDYNYEYISLNKEQFNATKDELVNFKTEDISIYDKGEDEEVYLKLTDEIKVSLEDIENIQTVDVYENKLGGYTGKPTAKLEILRKVKPTRAELAKEAFEIKELIKEQNPEIKYLDISFYEYGELNAKGGHWGQYYGSIFIGNEFAPWEITEGEVNTKLKVWEKL